MLDNCDKRLLEEQLLIFEAAQWLRTEFKVLVILPLREETYDNHQEQPPLDTTLKDLVFRIEPPNFQRILQSRIYLMTKEITADGKTKFQYALPNGMTASYLVQDQAHYLTSIMKSVFEHGLLVRRLIVGLAGRNMRCAMEIFLEFCTPGHISEEHIFKMVQSRGQYSLPFHLVATVLLRSRMRFYDGDKSYLTNLFSASEFDDRPAFFSRLLILQSLRERSLEFAKSRSRGFVRIGDLAEDVSRFGIAEDVFLRDVNALTKSFYITSEDFRTSGLTSADLFVLTPAGRVHLQIANDAYYLATVSEDMLFQNEALARSISDRIRDTEQHLSSRTTFLNATALVGELQGWHRELATQYSTQFSDTKFENFVGLSEKAAAVTRFEKSIVDGSWLAAKSALVEGAVVRGIKPYGLFVELLPNVSGLLHKNKCSDWTALRSSTKYGDSIEVVVLGMDVFGQKVELECRD